MEKMLDRLTLSLLCALGGILTVVLALLGGVSVGSVAVPALTTLPRVLLGVFGAVLLIAAFTNERSRAGERKTVERDPTSSPAQPPDSQASISVFTLDDSGSQKFAELVKGATRISILARTAVNLLNNYEALLGSLCAGGCELRVLLVDPNCEASKFVYGGRPEIYRKNIQSAASHIEHLQKAFGKTFEPRTIEHAPAFSLILVERGGSKTGHVQLYFLHSLLGRDRPVFRLASWDRWFSAFEAEFEALWKQGVAWRKADGAED